MNSIASRVSSILTRPCQVVNSLSQDQFGYHQVQQWRRHNLLYEDKRRPMPYLASSLASQMVEDEMAFDGRFARGDE
ncbi:hypothetical protein LWI28_021456 [Acer negundo]|uniref:Uncharacterized protein n=1 Tax=Acer negundo TaxID=4023 RepID=A0AAD5J7L2_ACENE|nr:hypothetical protein LWI28_021456 [Acer negundo]